MMSIRKKQKDIYKTHKNILKKKHKKKQMINKYVNPKIKKKRKPQN